MNFKRILSSALTVVMIFAMVAGFIPTRTYAAHSSSVAGSSSLSQDEVKKIVTDSYLYTFGSAEEMFEYEFGLGYLDSATSAGGQYSIYINRYTGVVYYINNVTGQILTSNPYNVGIVNSDDTKKDLMSQISIEFFETANSVKKNTYLSSTWAAEYAQISVSPIAQGLRVSYSLGDTSTRFLVPGQITAEAYTEHIMTPILNYYRDMLEKYIRDFVGETDENGVAINFDFFEQDAWKKDDTFAYGCINQRALRNYCNEMDALVNKVYASDKNNPEKKALTKVNSDILSLDTNYTLYNPAKTTAENVLQNMYKIAPLTEQGIAVYASKHNTVGKKRTAANMIRTYCPEYTFQLMFEHEAECLYVNEVEQKPVFRCSLEYTFNDDGSLSVRLPANSIAFDETAYTLTSIAPLKYFGAGMLDKEGYVFVPDGSGAIINFDDFYSVANSNNRLNVTINMTTYGNDFCYSRITGAHREQVTMPVYGLVSTDVTTSTDKQYVDSQYKSTGFFAILEEGAALANLSVRFGGAQHKFATAFASFNPYPSDTYDLSDTISVSGMKEYTMVSESKYTGSYVTRYVMLDDPQIAIARGDADFNTASYIGMATYYRNYLKSRGELTALAEVEEDLPLYIEALGSMEMVKKILTFPVTVSIPLTTFEDVITMYNELADAKTKLKAKGDEYRALGDAEEKDLALKETYYATADDYYALAEKVENITNVQFKLTGFANGGMYFTYPTRVKWEKVLGGKRGFNELLEQQAAINANENNNLGIYPEFDFMYMSNTAMFDGITPRNHLSRMVDNRYASKQVYNSVYGAYISYFSMVISPDVLDELIAKFDKRYSKYDISTISVSTLGSDLNSNFDEDNPINRQESTEYVVGALDQLVNEYGYSIMTSTGNIYSAKYAEHIIDVATDSSHFRYSSYAIPFTGLVLHGYVKYSASPLNYSGSPDYDMLRAIENGASLYYILCYQNTNFMKDDFLLSEYYGVDYDNWFDSLVESYNILNEAIGDLQKYEITDHKTLIAERVIDAREVEINKNLLKNEFLALVDSEIYKAVNAAFDEMFGDAANIGRGVKVEIDRAALIAQASDVLNISVDELNGSDFDEKLDAIIAKYSAEYPGKNDSYLVSISSIDYKTQYEYVTDSFAEDKNYVYTDYTVDNDLVVIVTYTDPETGDTVKFLLNYNIYTVKVSFDAEHTYTLDKYSFIRIDD